MFAHEKLAWRKINDIFVQLERKKLFVLFFFRCGQKINFKNIRRYVNAASAPFVCSILM